MQQLILSSMQQWAVSRELAEDGAKNWQTSIPTRGYGSETKMRFIAEVLYIRNALITCAERERGRFLKKTAASAEIFAWIFTER